MVTKEDREGLSTEDRLRLLERQQDRLEGAAFFVRWAIYIAAPLGSLFLVLKDHWK